jgi:hypothetical protein
MNALLSRPVLRGDIVSTKPASPLLFFAVAKVFDQFYTTFISQALESIHLLRWPWVTAI